MSDLNQFVTLKTIRATKLNTFNIGRLIGFFYKLKFVGYFNFNIFIFTATNWAKHFNFHTYIISQNNNPALDRVIFTKVVK